jgi:hypothetical protein
MTTPRRNLWGNPMGTDEFEFIEYTGPGTQALGALFERMGFIAGARHRSKNHALPMPHSSLQSPIEPNTADFAICSKSTARFRA